ncbi:glycosyltransferase [Aureisphaera sp. CAU 1614]|uniref:Glycosyltransferase n=1 Tax=Halomarinibacterium sedimenti TaxID=2857106 RepID=A0A9X1FNZ3_9FLAO|nr:glycosyltransferase [Halomarinibacterium sedimenti]MBW2937718.1 glycosyltransferase [Halomarinibacterium sedimenti]
MKVLHINTNDRGGAATAIIRIHLGLLKKGVDSKILFLNKRKNVPQSYAFINTNSKWRRIILKIRGLFQTSAKSIMDNNPEVEWFSLPTSPYDISQHRLYKEADIIQLNWVSGFLDEPSFFKKNTKPVVWRMPDLYACGGGYHYEKGFPFSKLKPLLERNEKVRSRALKNSSITFIPISEWVKSKAEDSPIISQFPKQVIHNGLDFSVWKPEDKLEARKHFQIPLDKKVLLIGADIAHVQRKGFQIAIDAIQTLNTHEISTVVFGNYKEKLPEGFLTLGKIQSETELARLYSAADYFIMPSIEEAFGQVTIEALSCGLPVISFPNGGSLDIIKPNINGIFASNFSKEALADAIKEAFQISFNSEIIIRDVRKRFHIEDKVETYLSLYQRLL